MIKVLISACLLGERVRYDGGARPLQSELIEEWQRQGRLLALCPEVAGGLPVPRPAAEIIGGDGRDVLRGAAAVRTQHREDVTAAFLKGAGRVLQICREHGVQLAVIKDNSPSCGASKVHDGNFTGTLRHGLGVTAALLHENGVRVFGETQLQQAARWLSRLEEG